MRKKCTCDMACHSYKMNVDKMFWGDTEVYVLQNMSFGQYQ